MMDEIEDFVEEDSPSSSDLFDLNIPLLMP